MMNNYKIVYTTKEGQVEEVDVVANTIQEAYVTFKTEFGVIPSSVSPK